MPVKSVNRQPGWNNGVLAPAVLLSLNVFILGTAAVYYGNQGEFLVEDEDVLLYLFRPALVCTFLLALLGYFAASFRLLATSAAFWFLALATYVHGNLLRWDAGVLDGAALDLEPGWPIAVDAVVWLVLAGLVWRFRTRLATSGWWLCLLLVVFQVAGALELKHNAAVGNRVVQEFPPALADFHDGRNVLHIILDGFQGSVFESVAAREPALFESWRGFVHFRDALTPSAVTYLSVPATLSGKAFDNSTTIADYHDETLGGENLYALLARHRFEIDVATPAWWHASRPDFSVHYAIPTPFGGAEETLRNTARYLLDLSLFRQIPYGFKPVVYRDGAWSLSSELAAHPEYRFEHFSHLRFMDRLVQNLQVGRGAPTYKFLHLISPHPPLVSRPDCGYTGGELAISFEPLTAQSLCTLRAVDRLLEKLEQLGIYDDTLILVHGDHGGGVPFRMTGRSGEESDSFAELDRLWGNPLPLVLIKKPGAHGPLQVSERPVSLTDYAVTVAEVLGLEHTFPGKSMFSPDPPAGRRMHYQSSQHRNEAAKAGRFSDFSAYAVEGSVFDATAWRRLERIED